MLHLLQHGVFGERHYRELLQALDRLQLSYTEFKFRPGANEMLDLVDAPLELPTTNVFCWGAVKLARVGAAKGWVPGSLFNENHDMRVYGAHYGAEMLNHDGFTIRFADAFSVPSYVFFARPTAETKAFTGQCFIRSSWDEFVTVSLARNDGRLTPDTQVLIAPQKDIQREFRTWIVHGRVITASQYRSGHGPALERCTEPVVLDYAERMAKAYSPADAFVLDVCMTDQGMRIVEVNCIHSAGFYEADLDKLLAAVEEAFSAQA
jgi:ATP-grasp domain, R2K clade family 3